MPAYSFKEQFIPFILDGSKDHTVRKERNSRAPHAKPGDRVYLYYGMRSKHCRKIGDATCSEVLKIRIGREGIHWHVTGLEGESRFIELTWAQANEFAWKDGFRPEGSRLDNPEGAYELMLRFWRQTHELPFYGVVIFWKDFKASVSSTVGVSV